MSNIHQNTSFLLQKTNKVFMASPPENILLGAPTNLDTALDIHSQSYIPSHSFTYTANHVHIVKTKYFSD